jgi:hypothetical protein
MRERCHRGEIRVRYPLSLDLLYVTFSHLLIGITKHVHGVFRVTDPIFLRYFQVAYTFTYSNESSNLEQLTVSFVLQNIQDHFLQKFSIRFLKVKHGVVILLVTSKNGKTWQT